MVNTVTLYEVADVDSKGEIYYYNFYGKANEKKKIIDKINENAQKLTEHGAIIKKITISANGYSISEFLNSLLSRFGANS